MNLGVHEQVCLSYLRTHEGDKGLDMNELVSGIGRECLSMDAEHIMNAINNLYAAASSNAATTAGMRFRSGENGDVQSVQVQLLLFGAGLWEIHTGRAHTHRRRQPVAVPLP